MATYDGEWAANYARRADAAIPGREGLYRLCRAFLTQLPPRSDVLVVGAGTGEELFALARSLPDARFVAIEPAEPMLAHCAHRVADEGLGERIALRAETLDAFVPTRAFDAATSILVSQHVVPDDAAAAFFGKLAALLRPGGLLFTADAHVAAGQDRQLLLASWRRQAVMSGIEPTLADGMLARIGVDPALRDEARIVALLEGAGFEEVQKVFGSLIYGAWSARRR
ncbi:MAG: class I SAM-dependent methyltransferase [Deltaproteobacteria bacterium]|nr:class I SAM-dependent methyltransferase [Deltaproteobacteria bacterium]